MEKYLRKDSPRDERNVFGKRDKLARSPGKGGSKSGNERDSEEKRKKLDDGIEQRDGTSKEENEGGWEGGIWKKLEEILQEIKKSKEESNDRFEKLQKEMEAERESRNREREAMKMEIKYLREKVEEYEEKLNDQENRSRRQNLIFRGVEEEKNESWEGTEIKVKKFVKEKYEVELKGIARAHRFGYQNKDWPRPIMVRFEREKEREHLLRNRKNLKGTKVFIDEDFAPDTRLQRKKLLLVMKEKRKEGKRAFIRFDKLEIEGEIFKWNLKKKEMERVGDKIKGKRGKNAKRCEVRTSSPKGHQKITSDQGSFKRYFNSIDVSLQILQPNLRYDSDELNKLNFIEMFFYMIRSHGVRGMYKLLENYCKLC